MSLSIYTVLDKTGKSYTIEERMIFVQEAGKHTVSCEIIVTPEPTTEIKELIDEILSARHKTMLDFITEFKP